MISYDGHVTDLTSELQEHMEREKELVKQYEDLYGFLSDHVAKSKVRVIAVMVGCVLLQCTLFRIIMINYWSSFKI